MANRIMKASSLAFALTMLLSVSARDRSLSDLFKEKDNSGLEALAKLYNSYEPIYSGDGDLLIDDTQAITAQPVSHDLDPAYAYTDNQIMGN